MFLIFAISTSIQQSNYRIRLSLNNVFKHAFRFFGTRQRRLRCVIYHALYSGMYLGHQCIICSLVRNMLSENGVRDTSQAAEVTLTPFSELNQPTALR